MPEIISSLLIEKGPQKRQKHTSMSGKLKIYIRMKASHSPRRKKQKDKSSTLSPSRSRKRLLSTERLRNSLRSICGCCAKQSNEALPNYKKSWTKCLSCLSAFSSS